MPLLPACTVHPLGQASASIMRASVSVRSSTNAYMLVYRQVDTARNERFTSEDSFCRELRAELDKLQNLEQEEQRLKELEKATCKV